MDNLKKLHIFTQNGNTYTFKSVRCFNFNESVVTFSFVAQSDGQEKKAIFFVRNMAGFTCQSE